MNKYQNGKIYKLVSSQTDKIYIGSTTLSLKKRFAEHKYTSNVCSSKLITCYDDVDIKLLEEYPCNNRKELFKKEGFYIRNNKCVNKQILGRTQKEYWFETKPLRHKRQREFYQENREEIIKKNSIYNKKPVRKIWEKTIVDCDCGKTYTKSNKARHMKSKFHLSNTARNFLI